LTYGLLGLAWALGAPGFPFGRGDPSADLTLLAGAEARQAGSTILALGLAGALVAVAMSRDQGGRPLLLAFGWGAAVTLAVVIPDYRVLVAAAYAPIIASGAPFDWPPGVSIVDVLPWPVVNQYVCIVGGVVWAVASLAYMRRSRGACARCGRAASSDDAGSAASRTAARWGSWATAIAVAVPLLYAATRWAWALGIPLGISEEFYREGQETGLWWAGAALGTLAVGGALLTLGLVRPWGEVFPRWLPLVGGRRVPILVAVIPATLVAVLVAASGLMFVRLTVARNVDAILGEGVIGGEDWAALAPELLWPLWGAALGAAAFAYYYRRRGRCACCGRL
jgi:hypothetical protein